MTETNKTSGFTIIELLIAIVVIAILGSISLSAFSGIQRRAFNTARIADARKMKALVEHFVTLNGPDAIAPLWPPTTGGNRCIGTGYIDVDPGAGTSCSESQDSRIITPFYAYGAPAFDDALKSLGNYTLSASPPVVWRSEGVVNGISYTVTSKRTAPLIALLNVSGSPVLVDDKPAFLILQYVLDGEDLDCGLGPMAVFQQYAGGVSTFTTQAGVKNDGFGNGITQCTLHIAKP